MLKDQPFWERPHIYPVRSLVNGWILQSINITGSLLIVPMCVAAEKSRMKSKVRIILPQAASTLLDGP